MEKQTLIWTALPHTSAGPVAEGTALRLSVHIAPRLWSDDPTVTLLPLSSYPDFLDWPTALAQAAFQVEFENGPTLPATPVNVKLRSDLWQGLFKTDTDVRPYIYEDLRGVPVQTFPASTIYGILKGVYQRVAIDPAYGAGRDLPGIDILAADPDLADIAREVTPEEPFVPQDTDRGPVVLDKPTGGPGDGGPGGCLGCLVGCLAWPLAIVRLLFEWLGVLPPSTSAAMSASAGSGSASASSMASSGGNPLPAFPVQAAVYTPPPPSANAAFNQLNTYLQPYNVQPAPLPTAQELEAQYDFHQMVSSLGDYPLLLRVFGLVVDLEVTLTASLPPLSSTVRVLPSMNLGMATTHYSPRTRYDLGDISFLAKPRPADPEISNGLLRLHDSSQFEVTQIDVAGGGIKLQNTATNMRGFDELKNRPANSPEDSGLPSLQTAGISVVRPEKGAALQVAFVKNFALNAGLAAVDLSPIPATNVPGPPPPPTDELFAEDLVRGYRIDVFDDASNAWHSLCQRLGTYEFPDVPGGPETLADLLDEGFVQMGATEPLPGTTARVLRVHDSLFTWAGWSLCAPRPGLTILTDHTPGEVPNTPGTQFQMETRFRARSGSLPRLRFGMEYRLRARVVDLAGNSVFTPDDPVFAQDVVEKTGAFKYRRYEPVSPPPLMLRAEPVEGESLERLVVRSAVTDAPAAIQDQTSERHLAPPKNSQLMAEQHGHFDSAPAMPDDQAAYDLASREAGSMTHRLNLASGDLELIPGVQEVATPERTIWLQANEQFEVAYLPDPFARGVLLLGLPGMNSFEEILEPDGQVVNKIPFSGAWPDLQAMRLRVMGLEAGAAPAQPQWDDADRILTVQLPQGETADVRVSSYFDPADLENTGLWEWVEEANPADLAALKAQYESGRTWLHLPYRDLVLVHAVQQPLAIPQISALDDPAAKALGDTAVDLNGGIDIDAKSTGKVDLWSRWEDPVDDPAQPAFHSESRQMHVAEIPAHDPANDLLAISGVRQAFGDTKYHRVAYWPVATTRFREYFPPAITSDPQNLVRPMPSEAPILKEIDIPNSSRPAAPRPLYLLPTFRWDEGEAGGIITKTRRGNGLRLYMERPWFSSGDKERLGVVIRPPNIDFDSPRGQALQPYTSDWGMDPLWNSVAAEPLTLARLVGEARRESGQNLALADLDQPGLRVQVAGYEPGYDAGRQLWYANIEMDPGGSYFPFVRLALARFHPISVAGAEISPVVQADFMQVVPHRTMTYDLNGLAADVVHIRAEGPSARTGNLPTLMLAHLEERDPKVADPEDELGWTPITAPAEIPPLAAEPIDAMVWELSLALPNPRPSPLRLVVREYERFAADREPVVVPPKERGPQGEVPPAGIPGMTDLMRERPRLVFADAIVLP